MSEDPDIYIFEAFVFLFSLRGIRVFLRTGLKGELVRTIGMLILLFFGMLENYQWGAIAGFVIFSIGWIILVTFENDKRNKIFRPLNYVDRLIGNVPKILPENENAVSMKYNKIIGVLSGIAFLLTALILYKRLTTFNVIETSVITIMALWGISFIIFYLFKKS